MKLGRTSGTTRQPEKPFSTACLRATPCEHSDKAVKVSEALFRNRGVKASESMAPYLAAAASLLGLSWDVKATLLSASQRARTGQHVLNYS